MKRPSIILAGAAALGTALSVPGARALRADAHAGTDTAAVSRSIAFFEAKLSEDSANTLVATRLVDRYVLRFQQSAALSDLLRAERLARDVVLTSHDPAADHARLSAVLLMQHDFAGAYDAAAAAVAGDGARQSALGALFDAALATGRYAQADSLLARLERGSIGWRLRQAHWLDAQGDAEGAFYTMRRVCDRFERAVMRASVRAWCLTELAGIERGRSGAAAAERLLRAALRVQPGYRGALEGRADLAHARGEWKRARGLYERIAVDAHPDLYLRLAEVHRALDDEGRAQAYERAFRRVASAPAAEALYALPLALHLAGRPDTRDRALAVALRDVARRDAVESWDVLSWVHLLRGELDAALQSSDRARAWGAPSPTMDFHRARILLRRGNIAEAGQLMKSALADPTLLEPHARAELSRQPVIP